MIFKAVFRKKIHLLNLKGQETIEELKKTVSSLFKLAPEHFEMFYIDEEGDQITLYDQQDFAILMSNSPKSVKIMIEEVGGEVMNQNSSLVNDQQESVEEEEVKKEPISSIPANLIKEEKTEEKVITVSESIIEEKFKKLLSTIVSRVKTEIQEEEMEKSKIYQKDQPVIIEEDIKTNKQSFKIQEKVQKIEPPKEEKMKEQKPKVIHYGVTCDNCGKQSIEGVRYKCAVCPDFDFCQECEATVEHPHPFVKIRTLQQTPLKIMTLIKDESNNIVINGHKIGPQEEITNFLQTGKNLLSRMFLNGFGGMGNCQARCPFFNRQKRKAQTEVPVEKERKMEEKMQPEVKKEKERAEMKEEKKEAEFNEQILLEKAMYLTNFGVDFDKCYQWAQTYYTMSKEELVEFCLNSPDFQKQ